MSTAESIITPEGSQTIGKIDKSVPAWKGSKTKYGKERQRLPVACLEYRKLKVKCDEQKPCQRCTRRGKDCTYACINLLQERSDMQPRDTNLWKSYEGEYRVYVSYQVYSLQGPRRNMFFREAKLQELS